MKLRLSELESRLESLVSFHSLSTPSPTPSTSFTNVDATAQLTERLQRSESENINLRAELTLLQSQLNPFTLPGLTVNDLSLRKPNETSYPPTALTLSPPSSTLSTPPSSPYPTALSPPLTNEFEFNLFRPINSQNFNLETKGDRLVARENVTLPRTLTGFNPLILNLNRKIFSTIRKRW